MEVGFRDSAVTIRAGEMFVVPKGVEHITRASRECHALIVEPRGVVNTGDAGGVLTAPGDVWVNAIRANKRIDTDFSKNKLHPFAAPPC